MIIEHYDCFSSDLVKLNKDQWEKLRNSTEKADKPYAFEETKEEYEKNCERIGVYKEAAQLICELLEKNNIGNIVSMGSGKGILEWHMKKIMPSIEIECTDFVESSMEKLSKVFTSCDKFSVFDMKNGDYSKFNSNSAILFFRVSEELSCDEWSKTFDSMKKAGIKNIIYVPDAIATEELKAVYEQNQLRNEQNGKKLTFCGWIYSEDIIKNFFEANGYTIINEDDIQDTKLYLLRLNNN